MSRVTNAQIKEWRVVEPSAPKAAMIIRIADLIDALEAERKRADTAEHQIRAAKRYIAQVPATMETQHQRRVHEVHRRMLGEDLIRSLWRSRRQWQEEALQLGEMLDAALKDYNEAERRLASVRQAIQREESDGWGNYLFGIKRALEGGGGMAGDL